MVLVDKASSRKLWIAWEDDTSIRSRVLAEELGASYQAYTSFSDSRVLQPLRYGVAALQTLTELVRFRPSLLVVQNPSVLLAFEAALLRPFFRYELLIDLHTPFNDPRGLTRVVLDFLHRFGLRHSSGVIVTNEGFKAAVSRQTNRSVFVLPDKVPDLAEPKRTALRGRRNVLYVCTYSDDEPWQSVVEAGALLPEDICIYVSGKGPLSGIQVPSNIIPTGYLPRNEYESLLQSVDAVMVLTTADDNLVCGGYEAVAAEKPLILSDTVALRELFGRGAMFTENEPFAIAASVNSALEEHERLQGDMRALRVEMDESWRRRWLEIVRRFEVDQDPSGGRDRSPLSSD